MSFPISGDLQTKKGEFTFFSQLTSFMSSLVVIAEWFFVESSVWTSWLLFTCSAIWIVNVFYMSFYSKVARSVSTWFKTYAFSTVFPSSTSSYERSASYLWDVGHPYVKGSPVEGAKRGNWTWLRSSLEWKLACFMSLGLLSLFYNLKICPSTDILLKFKFLSSCFSPFLLPRPLETAPALCFLPLLPTYPEMPCSIMRLHNIRMFYFET